MQIYMVGAIRTRRGNLSFKVSDETRGCWINLARVHGCLYRWSHIFELNIPVLQPVLKWKSTIVRLRYVFRKW